MRYRVGLNSATRVPHANETNLSADPRSLAEDEPINNIGAHRGSRTPDLPLTRRLLYQLSYAGVNLIPSPSGSGLGWGAAVQEVTLLPSPQPLSRRERGNKSEIPLLAPNQTIAIITLPPAAYIRGVENHHRPESASAWQAVERNATSGLPQSSVANRSSGTSASRPSTLAAANRSQ
jgi:hypothetical protein